MPKVKKYKTRTATDTNPLQKDEAHIKAKETVLPVIQSLKSANEGERKWSTSIITELVQDDTLRLTLLREGIVNALLDRLTDNSSEVKLDALGSIDALILKQGQSLGIELYRKNILKLLEMIAIEQDFTSKLGISTLEMVYTVLNRICCESEDAIEASIPTLLFTSAFTGLKSTQISLQIAAAQYIRTVTTDNPEAVQTALKSVFKGKKYDETVDAIYNLKVGKNKASPEDDAELFKLLLADIVVNIAEAYLEQVVPPPKLLNPIIQHAKSVFESKIKVVQNANKEPPEVLLLALTILSSVATYLETYLEIYPSSIPSEDEDTKMSEEESLEDEMMLDDIDQVATIDNSILLELLSAIPLILQQQLPILLILPALETINDIAWTMTLRISDWHQWQTIARQLLEFAIPRIEGMMTLGEDVLSTFLGCIWAAAKTLPGQFSLDLDDVQNLEKIYAQFQSAETQVKVVGILGCAAQHESVEMNAYITKMLMREIKSQFPLVVIEVMDAIIEIFADGEKAYDAPVFVEGRLLPELKQLVPQLRKKMKSIDGRKETELRERGDEVLETFIQFLKYKEDEAKHR